MAATLDPRLSCPSAAEPSSRGRVRRVLRRLAAMLEGYRARRALLALSDAQLRDIGLARGDLGGLADARPWAATDWTSLQRARDGRRD